jgi:hypothetical protein
MSHQQSEAVSPLRAIAVWLMQQDKEIQTDTAALVLMLTQDGLSWAEKSDPVPVLLDWLSDECTGTYRTIGKAVIFKAAFEHACAKRFTGEGWIEPEAMFRSVISEAASNQDSDAAQIAPSAFRMLRAIPERRELWKAAGKSWAALVQQYLTYEALNEWERAQFQPLFAP